MELFEFLKQFEVFWGISQTKTHHKFREWILIASMALNNAFFKLSEISSCVIKAWHLRWSESQQSILGSEEEYLNSVTVLLISPVSVSTSG